MKVNLIFATIFFLLAIMNAFNGEKISSGINLILGAQFIIFEELRTIKEGE